MNALDRTDQDRIDEYVLGLLNEAEAERLETRIAVEAGLAEALAQARERFLAFDDTAEPVRPSPELWRRIDDVLATSQSQSSTREETKVDAVSPQARVASRRAQHGIGLPLAAVTGLAASLILAAALAWTLLSGFDPVVVAALLDEEGEIVALVESSPDNRVKVTIFDEVALADDRVMQVWTKPDPDGPPVSMGIIEEVATKTLQLAGYPPPSNDQLYEITIERAGGSPTGLPTGTILGKGFAKAPR